MAPKHPAPDSDEESHPQPKRQATTRKKGTATTVKSPSKTKKTKSSKARQTAPAPAPILAPIPAPVPAPTSQTPVNVKSKKVKKASKANSDVYYPNVGDAVLARHPGDLKYYRGEVDGRKKARLSFLYDITLKGASPVVLKDVKQKHIKKPHCLRTRPSDSLFEEGAISEHERQKQRMEENSEHTVVTGNHVFVKRLGARGYLPAVVTKWHETNNGHIWVKFDYLTGKKGVPLVLSRPREYIIMMWAGDKSWLDDRGVGKDPPPLVAPTVAPYL